MTPYKTKTKAVISFENCAVFLVMTQCRTNTETVISFERFCCLSSYDTL